MKARGKARNSGRLVVAFVTALLAVLSSCAGLVPAPSSQPEQGVDEAIVNTVQIAQPEEALTFARTPNSLVGVQSYRDGLITGVDLTTRYGLTDPIALFQTIGYDGLAQAMGTSPDVSVEADHLIMPVTLAGHHIAAGANFPEHADEARIEEQPFLFAKLVQPSPSRSAVSVGNALLDAEVECAWVTLEPLDENDPMPEHMGLIAVNDFTDRDLLLRSIDAYDVESGLGFATGKSRPGYLPVGDLFVIPADYREYANARVLTMYVNGSLRQQSAVSQASWGIDDIVREARLRRDTVWQEPDGPVSLFPGAPGLIPARTLVLGGTPAGVIFNGVTVGQKAAGFFRWVFFGWQESIARRSIDRYIKSARSAGIYLQPGDEVVISIDGLGTLRTPIAP
jgi:2,4-diketo-3-deoxy-L-fuconate hydrolase